MIHLGVLEGRLNNQYFLFFGETYWPKIVIVVPSHPKKLNKQLTHKNHKTRYFLRAAWPAPAASSLDMPWALASFWAAQYTWLFWKAWTFRMLKTSQRGKWSYLPKKQCHKNLIVAWKHSGASSPWNRSPWFLSLESLQSFSKLWEWKNWAWTHSVLLCSLTSTLLRSLPLAWARWTERQAKSFWHLHCSWSHCIWTLWSPYQHCQARVPQVSSAQLQAPC